MFWRAGETESSANILIGFQLDDGLRVEQRFQRAPSDDNGVLRVSLTANPKRGRAFTLRGMMRSRETRATIGHPFDQPVLSG